jgi:MFS family permease
MRFLFGAAASVCEPMAYGVLIDFFPPNKIGVASAIFNIWE